MNKISYMLHVSSNGREMPVNPFPDIVQFLWTGRMGKIRVGFELICGLVESLYELRTQFSPLELYCGVHFTMALQKWGFSVG